MLTVSKGWGDLGVSCTRNGYDESTGTMSASFQTMTLGNVLLGGLIGVAVDAASGAMMEYPSSVGFIMFPVEFATAEDRDQLFARQRDALMAETERAKEQIRARCTTANCDYRFKPVEDARDSKLLDLEERRKRARVKGA
jgi:hypothetical protein